MTREIIETILQKEKTAEDIIAKAQYQAKLKSVETDQKITEMQKEFKQELKNKLEAGAQEVQEKSLKEEKKFANKFQAELDELAKTVQKNYANTKSKFLKILLD